MLWSHHQKAGTDFKHSNVFMTLSQPKQDEIKGSFGESPFKSIPQLNLSHVSQKQIDFDSQMNKKLPAKRYVPLIFEIDAEASFERFLLQ